MGETHDRSNGGAKQARLRALPSVTAVLERPAIRALVAKHGHAVVARAVREAIEDARRALLAGGEASVADDAVTRRAGAIARGTLRPVLNGSGVIVHTNLGRAPLAAEAVGAVDAIARGYATLEYDLEEGARGERHGHARDLLVELTGAEDALVVNNNAAAVMLVLATIAKERREVVVSHGELVEIGGGFRVPDVLEEAGAKLVAVGTTNRTHPRDYEQAIGAETAALLKVHRSNFAVVGFTAEVSVRELSAIAHPRHVPVVVDAGSGCVAETLAGADEPTIGKLIADGADVVSFSGDKLLGGPQAGIVVGRRSWIEPMRRHPLMRALRPDKLCLAALVATLRLWRDDPARIPVVRYASIAPRELEARARLLASRGAPFEAAPMTARIGGGAAPTRELASWGLRVTTSDAPALAARLREGEPAIVARIEDDALLVDLRCIPPEEDEVLVQALLVAVRGDG